MLITPPAVVTLKFILTDAEGNVLDQSQDESFQYVHGMGRILPGLEKALEGKHEGDNLEICLAPDDAFGHRDESRTEIAPLHLFKGLTPKPGMTFQARDATGRMMPLRVVRVEGEAVHVDANHPMAGLTLYFDVDVVRVRKASEQEMMSGQVEPED